MSVEQAIYQFAIVGELLQRVHDLVSRTGWEDADYFDLMLAADAASIALDLAQAEAHRTDWRTRQQIRWSDALHRTLLKSVAW